ncbi:hypothetical protein N0V91_007232 [Didymella pomorum]|uniref:Uncharacterized protein n=1 Tax=Didymella pomorum TaxID=749634 RepID=A0A9W8ZDL4_9PLEO|nr:hypothetical protein N0V91_007232 [Didymella pomorum]
MILSKLDLLQGVTQKNHLRHYTPVSKFQLCHHATSVLDLSSSESEPFLLRKREPSHEIWKM